MVKNPVFSAGDAGSIPGQGTKILHAMEQPSHHATTRVHVLQRKIPCDTVNGDPMSQHRQINKY